MKKQTISMFIILLMAFLYACSVDEMTKPNQVVASKELKCGQPAGAVFTILPSGGDDTQAFMDAFDQAKAAGSGSVVQLIEGVYNIGFTEVRDFHGTFRGAGKTKTRIQNIDNLPSVLPYYENNMWANLLTFVGGEVHISKMTFGSTDASLCPDDPYAILESLLAFSDYTAQYIPPKRFVKAIVEDVDFICGFDYAKTSVYGTEHNVNMILFVGSLMNICGQNDPNCSANITIKHCVFDHGAVALDTWGLDETSTVVFEDNKVRNTVYSIFLGASLGMKAYIRNNKLYEAPLGTYIDDFDYGIMLNNQLLRKRTEYYITGNFWQCKEGLPSLYFKDSRRIQHPEEGLPQYFYIENNYFETSDAGLAISGLNTVESSISNNKFTGTGSIGILLDGDSLTNTYAERNRIFGNNFYNVNFTDANIVLGKNTKNCSVIGSGNNNGSVIDLGMNNTVTSFHMKQQGGHWGYHPSHWRQGLNMQIRSR